MVDPPLSYDLRPFLMPNLRMNSAFMIAVVKTAALMSENKHLAKPWVTDSILTSERIPPTSIRPPDLS